MAIGDAISAVQQFKGDSLTQTIAAVESHMHGAGALAAAKINDSFGVSPQLLSAAAAVKQASAQINVVVHAIGILRALPHILREEEVVESLSLGAGSAGSDFDLVTNERIAEFKFIRWQDKGNAVRNSTLFQDYYRLVREETDKQRYLYLLETEIPLRFLRGRRDPLKVLARSKNLREDFAARYEQKYPTVGEYYRAHQDDVHIVDLTAIVPELDQIVVTVR
jgi:hypothetical protein